LVDFLKQKKLIQQTSFDESLHPTAQISDIDPAKIDNFLNLADYKRGFPVRQGSSIEKVLTHLNILHGDRLCNSAILAFGKNPQQFFPTAVVKCAHFHGYIVEKPIPDHKVFDGDVFQQVDNAVDFVLSKIGVSVGLRDESTQAPIKYEIPRPVVTEAIVNAVAHRNYNSNGSVQVMLFANRLEIANPGGLTPELSLSKLKTDHGSYPTNPKLAEPMYQAGYIERFGTGTGEIIRLTVEAGLQEPKFDFEEGFKVIIWRPTGQVTGQATGQATEGARRVILVLHDEMKSAEIQELLELKHRESFRDNYLIPAMEEGWVEMTIPDKPNSPNQRYRLTAKGLVLKETLEKTN
jgi:predicted HTH transcriptional regulator